MGRRKKGFLSDTGQVHLVIGDPHAMPEHSNRRFDWLGQIIVDLQPDKVICIGDMADMEALCEYDKGTRKAEGRRYIDDVNAAIDAQERMMAPLAKYNKGRLAMHRKQYRPEFHMCMGNHEHRIERATQKSAELHKAISFDDLKYKEFGWKVHDYMTEVELDGVWYSHLFVSGVMDRAISGEHPATMHLNKQHRSCTAGHSHLLDFSVRRQGTEHIMSSIVGCYFDFDMAYVSPNVNNMWWRGLTIKRNVCHGRYDPQFYSLNSIKRDYA